MSTKDFTDLTREELIEEIVNKYDPEICQHKQIIALVNENTENMYAIKIRHGHYFVAEFDWKFYNDIDSMDLNWEQITKEEFRQYIYESLSTRTLNELRIKYQVARKEEFFIKENENLEKRLIKAMYVIKKLDIGLIRRISKTSHIPDGFTYVGNAVDKLNPALFEEFNIDPNISIWQNERDSILLTAYVNEEYGFIEALALKDLDRVDIFKDDKSEGLKAILDKLSEALLDNESDEKLDK